MERLSYPSHKWSPLLVALVVFKFSKLFNRLQFRHLLLSTQRQVLVLQMPRLQFRG
ncbi:unnamed protein product [Protopolystoma xenopodis]|uniref:Uncharacterized protein n=1 Tax=Protopolystoma xenopodis TaxID=117903 RepID=A0A448X731_9PLAT|nr:unnamed protein product [Protopolystoma xenopodis]